MYLGFKTIFRSSGSSPGTLAPQVGRGGVQNPFYVPQQVSEGLDLLGVHPTDLNEGMRAHAGPFYAIFNPLLKGVKSHFCDCVRTRCAVVLSSWTLIKVCIGEGIAYLPRCRVRVSCLRRCGRVSTPLWLSRLIRSLPLLAVLFTRFTRR